MRDLPGIHHVTSLVADAAANRAFYADVLGLRLVKRTVNHEDMLTHHLYYGNESGEPGTLYTCFPSPNEVSGRVGKPGFPAAAFAVPEGSLDYWRDRLDDRGVAHETESRMGDDVLSFSDPADTRLELVAAESPVAPWTEAVPERAAIRGLHGVTALPSDPFGAAAALETFGFALEAQDGDRVRYRAPGDRATVVDILDREDEFGREGTGSIHHVALRVPDDGDLREWDELLRERDYHVSEIRNRGYFRSLYVRAGGVLFELATDGPGLTVDEPVPELGSSLVLPPFFEDQRDFIEDRLPPLR